MSRLEQSLLLAAALLLGPAAAALAGPAPAYGFAVLGTLKYPENFRHFDYADPAAPKGGRVRLWVQGSFDSLNPFVLQGYAAQGSNPFGVDGRLLTFDTLMTPSADEPDSYYGLIAGSAELPDDRQSIIFNLRPQARWHDGSAITADDVVFSFDTLKAKGHPAYAVMYRDVARAVKLGPHRVRFDFAEGAETRDLPALVAELPVLSRAWYAKHPFEKADLTPPLGSGPYRVDKVDPGRSITYRRVAGYWGRDLPVNRGRWNFERITWDYYRDRDVALEAMFAGRIDFREEFTSRDWATKYDVPAVNDGRIKRESLPDNQPSGFQAWFINTRRDKFADPRVRKALGLLFDFEWTNRTLFYGLYKRTYSIFQNSDLESSGKPGPAELKLLEPWRGKVPDAVFGPAYRPAKTDGSGRIRAELREARALLQQAGWTVRDGKLSNAAGKPMTIEFLSYSRGFERIVLPYIRNMQRLGIEARFRVVEPAQYQQRVQGFDFDMTTFRFSSSLTPGVSLRNVWTSTAADVQGSHNYAGVKSPAVDDLVEKVIAAESRDALRTATAALDRVVMWGHYLVPQWYKARHDIAYWDIFSRPAVQPKYALGMLDTWWIDPARARALGRGQD